MKIHIIGIDSSPILLDVSSSETVVNIKKMIHKSEGDLYAIDIQILLYEEKELENEKTLADYGLQNDSQLKLVRGFIPPSLESHEFIIKNRRRWDDDIDAMNFPAHNNDTRDQLLVPLSAAANDDIEDEEFLDS